MGSLPGVRQWDLFQAIAAIEGRVASERSAQIVELLASALLAIIQAEAAQRSEEAGDE